MVQENTNAETKVADNKIEEISITEFIEGESLFSSSGISKVKVTKNGVIKIIKVPIQSTGVSELIDTYKEKEPKPPKVQSFVTPDSDVGKALGITKKNAVWHFDFTDEKYIKLKEEHDSDLGMAILMRGLAVELKDKEGNIITDFKRKIEILKSAGMSGEQFSQVVQDIQSLTKWSEEERQSFL